MGFRGGTRSGSLFRMSTKSFRRLSGFAILVAASAAVHAALAPTDLRCEYRRNPLGIDTPAPRLSWILQTDDPDARSQSQTAWQVLVASDLTKLRADEGDLWDSGQVRSGRSIQVPYAGRPLASDQECFWKVRVWDQDGRVSRWSAPARWVMGLLNPNDWKGSWIGLDEKERPPEKATGRWIWFPEGNPARSAPPGKRFFRKTFRVPGGAPVVAARLRITADNHFTAYVNGVKVGANGNFKAVSEFDVTANLRVGRNALAIEAANAGPNNNPAGLLAELTLRFADDRTESLRADASWRCAKSVPKDWTAPVFDDDAWVAAKVLGPAGMAPWGELTLPQSRRLAARYVRKEFSVKGPVRRALVHFSGLGLSELYLNGGKVGTAELSPGLTDYGKRVFYVTHEVTRQLQPGANALGVALGNGRYYAPRLSDPTKTDTYGHPKLRFQLRIDYVNGETDWVVSDDSWELTTDGPIQANNEYDGEEYDARREMPGWTRPGFKDPLSPTPNAEGLSRVWQPARVVKGPAGRLVAEPIEPIRVTDVLRPVAITEPKPGVYIFDLGQNMVGWCRLHVQGPRGTRVRLRHAETLKPDGTLYVANLRGAKVTDIYTLKGGGPEVYEPTFTYHGFRYVEVRGYPGRPGLDALEGCVVHDDLETAGRWVSSHPLLNRLHRNIRWGVRGNYRSIPTDCPQRDERQGWLGDRSAESRGEAYLYQTAALYAKWVQDMEDAQREDGVVPDVCPPYWPIYSDNVTWPSSTVIIPHHLLVQFDDTRLVKKHYASMKRWMDHLATHLKDGLLDRDQYGDWCVPPEDPLLIHSKDPARKTSKTLLASSYYFHCCELMANYARLLDKTDDARDFAQRAATVKAAFNRRLYDPAKGYYDNGSQTSCVLPLAFGMTPETARETVLGRLLDKIIHECHRHVGTGLIGGQWLMRTLTANGQADLGYTLATNTTYPSWGYMIRKGATTVWELWNGDTADPAMNSGNHVMLVGDFIIWSYENLAGIQPDPEQRGFKRIRMRPVLAGDLRFVQAAYQSPHGEIRSYWRRHGDRLEWRVTVPPNTTARVSVPAAPDAEVRESGRPAGDQPGLRFLGRDGDYAVFDVGSGRYRFTSRWR